MSLVLCRLAASLAAVLLLVPAAANASSVNLGGVACSGALNIEAVGSVGLSCDGNLSLSDSVINDPIQILIEASGTLTLTRVQLTAPIVWFAAEFIEIENSVVFGGQLVLDGDVPLDGGSPPNSEPPQRHVSGSVTISSGRITQNGGSVISVSGSGDAPPISLSPSSGGSIALMSDSISLNGGSLTLSSGSLTLVSSSFTPSRSSSGTPPVSLIPEPSAAMLLTAGLGVIMLRRQTKTGSR